MIYSPIYYVQSNIFCVIVLAMLLILQYKHNKTNTTETVLLRRLIYLTMAYCVSDACAWLCNGAKFTGSHAILEAANIIYICMPALFAYIWLQYVYYKLYNAEFIKTLSGKLIMIPLVVATAVVAFTHFTHLGFTIDSDNIYHRQIFAYILPVLCLANLIFSIIIVWRYVRAEANKIKRDEAKPLLFFGLPMLITAVIQLLSYGLTINQLGFTFIILLLYFNMQYDKISVDDLTGLNNRREFKQYLYGMFNSDKTNSIFMCMIDVDFFKTINDTYGHVEGDIALKNVANLLKRACGAQKQRVFLARYGGDEFVIAGVNTEECELEKLKADILSEVKVENENSGKPYTLSLSFGYSIGNPKELGNYENLLKKADERMYEVKKKRVR